MTRTTRATLTTLALLLATGVAAAEEAAHTTVILVRHAEKLLTGGDVPLKEPEGTERARALVDVVRHAGVSVAIASKYRRTQMTLAPSVAALGLEPGSVLERTEASEVAAEILAHHRGRTILVAGHSDTVPGIIEALGAPSLCPPFEVHPEHGCMIPDPEYDHLFIVRVPNQGAATVVRARYGAASP